MNLTDQTFPSYKAISAHFGKTNGVHFVDGDRTLPFICVEDVYYYFGQLPDQDAFRLVMTSSKNIGD